MEQSGNQLSVGYMQPGESRQRIVSIGNIGTEPLDVTSVVITSYADAPQPSGSSALDAFSMDAADGVLPLTLEPLSTLEITVRCTLSTVTVAWGTLVISSSDPSTPDFRLNLFCSSRPLPDETEYPDELLPTAGSMVAAQLSVATIILLAGCGVVARSRRPAQRNVTR